jgi:hypothetical protein
MLKTLWLLLAALFTIGGGDPDDDGGDPPTPDPKPDDPPADPDDEDDPPAGGDNPPLDPEAMAKEMEKARKQAAKYRTERNAERERIGSLEEQNKAILKALGISEDEDDDPEAKVAQLQAENRRLRSRQDFDRLARDAGADEDLTWGFLLARGEIDTLDPDSDEFEKTVQELVTSALEAKPGLAVKPASPPKGGADLNDDGNPDAVKPEEMDMDEYMAWRAERDKKKE